MKIFSFKTLLLISIVSFIALPFFLKHGTPGSFEYVRKAERYLEKFRYTDAIKYFEKAYESSPANEIIRSELASAYLTYAKTLLQKQKYEEALNYFQKSYSVIPNAKNIAILLYNNAVEEYKSGREDMAIFCLRKAVSVYKNSRIFDLLGDMYYRTGNLRMARFCWHEAGGEKLIKIRKEMALAHKQKEETFPHFEIKYEKDLPIDKKLAIDALESAYTDVGKDLGYFPKAKTDVIFYSRKDFQHIFKMPYAVKAFYDGSIKIPFPDTTLGREEFVKYIYHEYTHALVSEKTKNNCPVWFGEGIAVWVEYKGSDEPLKTFFAKADKTPDISLRFLTDSFKTEEITNEKAMGYLMAYTLVSYIVDSWGTKGLQNILKRMADKQHVINAIDDEFLLSEKELETRWRNYTINKYFKNIVNNS